MKIVGIIIVLLVLLGGIAFGLVKFNLVTIPADMVPGPLRPYLVKGDEPPPPPPPPAPSSYVEMEQFVVPIIVNGTLKGSILIEVRLEVDPHGKSHVEQSMPLIHDAIIRGLYDFLPKHMEDRRTADLQVLKAEIQRICTRVVGEGIIRAVLVQNVYNR
ncbi:MAG: hypothetical protein H7840_03200 [Alphaproteobacteria bacterium]